MTTALRVRFGETDAAGIVFYPNIFAYFDVAAHELLRSCGYALGDRLRNEGNAFPLVESGARFHAPLRHDQEFVATASVSRVGTSSFRLEYRLERGAVLCAEGFEVRVFTRLSESGLTSEPIPADLRAALMEGSG
jgi:4-hydroxybenzoyl-CoA thioesterase